MMELAGSSVAARKGGGYLGSTIPSSVTQVTLLL